MTRPQLAEILMRSAAGHRVPPLPMAERAALIRFVDGLDRWIEGDPGIGLDSEPEADEPCELCGGRGGYMHEPADPTRAPFWSDCEECN